MGRYVICGPACSKKCSGPDSMSGDARARFLELRRWPQDSSSSALTTSRCWLRSPKKAFSMKASKWLRPNSEASVQNLVDVENSAMVRPRVCNVSCLWLCARFDARSKGIRPHRIFRTSSGEERRLARDRDEGIPTIATEGADASVITTDPEAEVTIFSAVDSFHDAAVCAKTRGQGRSHVRTLLRFPFTQEACFSTPSTCDVMTTHRL